MSELSELLPTSLSWIPDKTLYYTSLSEPQLATELERLARPTSKFLADAARVDSLSIQPCLSESERNQDRLFVESVPGVGTVIGVLDGHAGHEAVDLALRTFPSMLHSALSSPADPETDLGVCLSRAIASVDTSLAESITSLFPDLEAMSDEEVDAIVEENRDTIALAQSGTTALLALVDEKGENVWIANLGDCMGVLATQAPTGEWTHEVLTKNHNAAYTPEVERIRAAHPGEEGAVTGGRVLGAIAVTRALGDLVFKLPAIYTRRVFLSPSARPFRKPATIRDTVLPRILTPPYLTAQPEVVHHHFPSGSSGKKVLILCSDGLPTMAQLMNEHRWRDPSLGFDDQQREEAIAQLEKEAVDAWVRCVTSSVDDASGEDDNLALKILRSVLSTPDGMGHAAVELGEREKVLSRALTLECEERWMDDITLQVVRF